MQFETLQFFTAKAYGIGFSGMTLFVHQTRLQRTSPSENESYEKIQKLLTFFLFNDNLHKK